MGLWVSPAALTKRHRRRAQLRLVAAAQDELQRLPAPVAVTTDQEHEQLLERCRQDPNAFLEYAFRDEEGDPLRQAPHHREWQELWHGDLVCILGHAEAGKTVQLGGRLVWELGRNPRLRILLLGASQLNPKKVLGVISRAIARNPRVREVWPALRPAVPWNETGIAVEGRIDDTKDFSVQAAGQATQIMGGRFDIVVVDDIHNSQNSRTPLQREKIARWFDQEVQSRRTRRGKVWVVGNAWHRDDLLFRLKSRPAWTWRLFSVLDARGRSRWPEAFPATRLAAIRAAIGSLAFARMYLCQANDDQTQRFKEPWLKAARTKGRQRGAVWRPDRSQLPKGPDGNYLPVFVGVDLSSGKRARLRKTDSHVLFAICRWPNGWLQLLDIQIGTWPAPELVDRMERMVELYDPHFYVEDNATQQLFVDLYRKEKTAPRVRGFTTTGVNKWDPFIGIDGVAIDFEAGRWIVPEDAAGELPEEVERWFQDLLAFTPAEHSPDSVIGCWLATTAARHGTGKALDYQPHTATR